jgi:hypothetical protein
VSDFSHYRDLRSTVLLDSQGFEVECEAWNLLTLQMILFIFVFCFGGYVLWILFGVLKIMGCVDIESFDIQ